MFLLVPGRHHLLTSFQHQEFYRIISKDICSLKNIDGEFFDPEFEGEKIDHIVFAVTSANHCNTRRNPLSGSKREAMLTLFGQSLNIKTSVFLIDDVPTTSSFGHYCIENINVQSSGKINLTPQNCIVGCSTPSVINMYQNLGFGILPLELETLEPEKYLATRPREVMENLARTIKDGIDWTQDDYILKNMSPVSKNFFQHYSIDEQIKEIFFDPLLQNDGDITETRDYNTYVRAFDEGAERKYNLVKDFLQPGKIVDIGCCSGSFLQKVSQDKKFLDSDLYGIEVAQTLFQECQRRKQTGYFGSSNIFFYQKNVANDLIFSPSSVDCFTTFSLTHEIFSYQGVEVMEKFLNLIFQQLNHGGVWINNDVVGPKNKNQTIYAFLSQYDGVDFYDFDAKNNFKDYLDSLSSYAKFLRFGQDFRATQGEKIDYQIFEKDGQKYIQTSLENISEFLNKKDYTDNRKSEMNERFCYWDIETWKEKLTNMGFEISNQSCEYQNPWIVQNRRQGIEIFDSSFEKIDLPVTNMLLIAKKV